MNGSGRDEKQRAEGTAKFSPRWRCAAYAVFGTAVLSGLEIIMGARRFYAAGVRAEDLRGILGMAPVRLIVFYVTAPVLLGGRFRAPTAPAQNESWLQIGWSVARFIAAFVVWMVVVFGHAWYVARRGW